MIKALSISTIIGGNTGGNTGTGKGVVGREFPHSARLLAWGARSRASHAQVIGLRSQLRNDPGREWARQDLALRKSELKQDAADAARSGHAVGYALYRGDNPYLGLGRQMQHRTQTTISLSNTEYCASNCLSSRLVFWPVRGSSSTPSGLYVG